MSTPSTAPIALIGATGQQGRHVVDGLLETGATVRAIVRNPDSPAARELAVRGVEIVPGDQENPGSLLDGLNDVAALWFMTTFDGPDGTEGETRRGINVADAATRARVPRVVFTSVGGAERRTGIPHFESKRRIEERLLGRVPTSVLRPVFFMENLLAQLAPDQNGEIVVRMPMPGDVPIQMVAVRDVGHAAAHWLTNPTAIHADAFELGIDELTLNEAATAIGKAQGVPARFEQIPLNYLPDEDLRAMFEWFASGDAYQADLIASRSLLPDATDMPTWLAQQSGNTAD